MAGITGQGTTFNLPNFTGELYGITPEDTPFLSTIGGLAGGDIVAGATEFEWQFFDLREADQRTKVEGANAPTAEERVRSNASNVVQIHQEAVETSYTKNAAFNALGGINVAGLQNSVLREQAWQVIAMVKQIARDVEWSFVNGRFAKPSTNATARKTRGLLQAIETNRSNHGTEVDTFTVTVADPGVFTSASTHGMSVDDQVQFVEGDGVMPIAIQGAVTRALEEGRTYYVKTAPSTTTFTIALTKGGDALEVTDAGTDDATRLLFTANALTSAAILDTAQTAFDNGGLLEGETRAFMGNSWTQRMLTKLFITDSGYEESSRNVGGVALRTIETDFGVFNRLLNRHMPNGALALVSLEECKPRFLPIPDKGLFFQEELSKVGASNRTQLYGEIGLEYGNERKHALLVGLTASAV